MENKKSSPRSIFKLVIVAAVLIFLAISLLSGGVKLTYDDSGFTVSALGVAKRQLAYSDITAASWLAAPFDPGTRVVGVGGPTYRAGTFQGGSVGEKYALYLDGDYNGPVLLLTTADGLLAVGVSEVDMQAFYGKLQEACGF